MGLLLSFHLLKMFFPAHTQGDSPVMFLLLASPVDFTAERLQSKREKEHLKIIQSNVPFCRAMI